MSVLLQITTRVIQRRLDNGELLENILLDYPKLTPEEIELIKQNLK